MTVKVTVKLKKKNSLLKDKIFLFNNKNYIYHRKTILLSFSLDCEDTQCFSDIAPSLQNFANMFPQKTSKFELAQRL